MYTKNTTLSRLHAFEFIFENNSCQFFSSSLQHALIRIIGSYHYEVDDGSLLEVILPGNIRLEFDYHIFINEFFRRKNISLADLIRQQIIIAPRKVIALNQLPAEVQQRVIYIRDAEGWDELLPIAFYRWFGNYYAMHIGDTNTRWFYDKDTRELD